MTVENATYIKDLQPNLPRGTDSRSEGDDHIRMVKSVLKNTFPGWDNAAGYVTSDVIDFLNEFVEANRGLPTNAIVLWHGGPIPDGWALCDGTNGTPNLKDRFPVGVGADRVKGDAGGNNDLFYSGDTEETVLRVEELPPHSHLVKQLAHKDEEGFGQPVQNVGSEENADHALDLHSKETGGSEGHLHSYTFQQTDANIPSFYAAIFIMKL